MNEQRYLGQLRPGFRARLRENYRPASKLYSGAFYLAGSDNAWRKPSANGAPGPALDEWAVPARPGRHLREKTPVGVIGTELRDLRKAAGLTQIALADLLGIKPSNICQIERGTYTPSVERWSEIRAIIDWARKRVTR